MSRTAKQYDFMKTAKKRVKCPQCGFLFSILYGRAIACQGCRKVAIGCSYARCIKCDSEFPIKNILLPRELRTLSEVYSKYYSQFGMSLGR